jgi:uncharacterized protein (DUF983 family)
MSFRGEEMRRLCAVCRSPGSAGRCPRCGRALCPRHSLGVDERCPHCEEEFERDRRQATGRWLLIAAPSIVVLFLISGPAITVAAVLAAGLVIHALLLPRLRRQFMSEGDA